MRNWAFLGVVSLVLAGCAGIKVTKPSPEKLKEYGSIDGLPFYIKVPICVHETKWMERQLIATVAYDEKSSTGKSVRAERTIVIVQWKTKPQLFAASEERGFTKTEILNNQGGSKTQHGLSFSVTFKPLSTIVTARRVSGGANYRTSICEPEHHSPKADTKAHAPWLDENWPDVQVTRETVGESAKREGADDSAAYKINGSITLPKAK